MLGESSCKVVGIILVFSTFHCSEAFIIIIGVVSFNLFEKTHFESSRAPFVEQK